MRACEYERRFGLHEPRGVVVVVEAQVILRADPSRRTPTIIYPCATEPSASALMRLHCGPSIGDTAKKAQEGGRARSRVDSMRSTRRGVSATRPKIASTSTNGLTIQMRSLLLTGLPRAILTVSFRFQMNPPA